MRVSTITTCSPEQTFTAEYHAENDMPLAQRLAVSLLKTLKHVGTAIALGEQGDLEAADAFRRKNSGQ